MSAAGEASLSPRPIDAVAASLGLRPDEWEQLGAWKGKLRLPAIRERLGGPPGKLVLVTAITPTPAGEGKTTVTIGLAQGLNRIGVRAIAALREPSLGPVFGMKGGATGGGRSTLVPSDDINLHFTGDLHAITAANNLLAAVIDNHLHFGNPLHLNTRRIAWKRCIDLNDRSLRNVVTGLGGDGVPRESGFEITAASEVMALLCLAESYADLQERLARLVIGQDRERRAVTAGDLKCHGAMAVLLRDALKPNLVQTVEGTPAIVHGGPFGNIAHGCNSVLATRAALALGDLCVTEAGFGADLGAEKFLNIKMRQTGLKPSAAVLVATVRALKMHGGMALADLTQPSTSALQRGFANLQRHAENLAKFGLPVVVAINRFASDTSDELSALADLCRDAGLPCAVADVFGEGGAGAISLAELVAGTAARPSEFRPLYPDTASLDEKLRIIGREIYRADSVELSPVAERRIREIEAAGHGGMPICVAKTQYSFSDDPTRLNAPTGHTLTIRDARLSAGAGFVVAYAGTLVTMPGLPRVPTSERMSLDDEGEIIWS